MSETLAAWVHVLGPDNETVVSFGPGSTPPEWAARKITNPKAWTDGMVPSFDDEPNPELVPTEPNPEPEPARAETEPTEGDGAETAPDPEAPEPTPVPHPESAEKPAPKTRRPRATTK